MILERKALDGFRSLRILVLGDFMLDHFLWGRVDRISPEAPVPVVDFDRETFGLGGAGNVARNACVLGASVIPIGVIGKDSAGDRILDQLAENKIDSRLLFRTERPTTQKTRIIAHQQQVVRVDREERGLISSELQELLCESFLRELPDADGVIVSDYAKGCVTPNVLSRILPEARKQQKLVCIDPKPRYFFSYTPVTILTPNLSEAASVLGYPIVSEDDLREAGRRIREKIDCEALLITRGDRGMAVFSGDQMTLVPARAREVYDVTGAGDTVITALCLPISRSDPP